MTLDEYKEECTARLAALPPNCAEDHSDIVLGQLFWLYKLALKGTEEESKECLAHWMSLPVDERPGRSGVRHPLPQLLDHQIEEKAAHGRRYARRRALLLRLPQVAYAPRTATRCCTSGVDQMFHAPILM
jgi:hypothetical protein